MGVASIKWVLPILTTSLNSFDLLSRLSLNFLRFIRVFLEIIFIAAIFIAVGKVSFDDWERLTSSLGDNVLSDSPNFFPSIKWALLEITSFIFILVWVPDPVCQITKGNWSLCLFSSISSQTFWIKLDFSLDRIPKSSFVCAADFLITA